MIGMPPDAEMAALLVRFVELLSFTMLKVTVCPFTGFPFRSMTFPMIWADEPVFPSRLCTSRLAMVWGLAVRSMSFGSRLPNWRVWEMFTAGFSSAVAVRV